MNLVFRWVRETQPGPKWKALASRFWPSYARWFAREGDESRPSIQTCREKLELYMPELVTTWEKLTRLTGRGETAGRLLALWNPTPYVSGCSQVAGAHPVPYLIRNYDYHPAACEGTILHSRWNDTCVMASIDSLWGVLDGINEHGLAVALAFGGRKTVGDGFGIPLLLRYVLETCRDTKEAIQVLSRVPSHMAYNISVVDRAGAHAVVEVGPDRKALVHARPIATNHQGRSRWTEYQRLARSKERYVFLEAKLEGDASIEDLSKAFLKDPLFVREYARGFGTLYTSSYFPKKNQAHFIWPHGHVSQSIDQFIEKEWLVPFSQEVLQ